MYMDQIYQVRAIMEATGAIKDAPVIRELLDEALAARRRKAAGITDSEEPPGQEITEALHTLQTLLLKLIRREAGGQSAAASGHRRREVRCSLEEGFAGQTIPMHDGRATEP